MDLQARIQSFVRFKEIISSNLQIATPLFEDVLYRAEAQNPWFTRKNILHAFNSICSILEESELTAWVQHYNIEKTQVKTIALVLAGNIPMVGFHDVLCVLISGNKMQVKLSSKDTVLMTYVLKTLQSIEPQWGEYITIESHIVKGFDAIIATGSSNSSRYFEYYFEKYPHIIRKNRNSVAVVLDSDTSDIYTKLASDIFSYFGLGCRNVSKLYVPKDFSVSHFFEAIQSYDYIVAHSKYMNNYEYNKSIYLVGGQQHYDNGFVLLTEHNSISSPLAVVYFEKYVNFAQVQEQLQALSSNIQCIVSTEDAFYKKNVLPGYTQCPSLWDYADDIDTMNFLLQFTV
ncbi:MAG TPA: acyl-CoA reductase [Bacteroidales bacterium]|mgnify:CR=1 FL=1|nr:MAG: Acyl-CoA reductase (LuxC) [Bacteroidetes bacterium ADurb.Bin217]HPH16061.1 acyl-CoA reductase [Bacteroidales bacterium]HPM11862.1 acyl-CoA reductase [Bacteroidales bacterium]